MIGPFLIGVLVGAIVTFAALFSRMQAEKDRFLDECRRRLQDANDFNVGLMGDLPGKRRAQL